jgi:VanZ family protein
VTQPAPETFREGARLWKGLAAVGLAGILISTLYPSPDTAKEVALTPLSCLLCGMDPGADVLLNLLLFIPFAVGLRLSGLRWWRVVGISALLSLTVETLQFTVVTGRDASLSDLLTNTTGSAIGAGLARLLPPALGAGPRYARRLMYLWATLWLAELVIAAWLMQPWVPETEIRSRWAPTPPGIDPFRGRVVDAVAGGFSLPNGKVPDSAAAVLREALRQERIDLQIEAVSGSPRGESAWVYVLDLGPVWSPILNQEGRKLLFSIPVRALRLGLRSPTIELPEGFPSSAGEQVRVAAREASRRLQLTSSYGGIVRTSEAQLSPAQGWVLAAVFGMALGPRGQLFTALYLIAWLLPLGYWAARSGWTRGVVGVVTGTLVLGLGLIPFWTGYPPVPWSEWAGALTGMLAGWALYQPAAYLETRCASPSIGEFSSS